MKKGAKNSKKNARRSTMIFYKKWVLVKNGTLWMSSQLCYLACRLKHFVVFVFIHNYCRYGITSVYYLTIITYNIVSLIVVMAVSTLYRIHFASPFKMLHCSNISSFWCRHTDFRYPKKVWFVCLCRITRRTFLPRSRRRMTQEAFWLVLVPMRTGGDVCRRNARKSTISF